MKLVEYVVIATTLFGLSAFFEVTTKMQYFNVGVMTVQQKELERDLREMIGPCAPQESGHRPCNSFESWFDQTDLSRVSTSDLREFLNALIMLQDMDIHPEQVGSQEEQREMERQLAAQRDALIILSRIRSPFHQYVELREKIDHLQNRQPISFSPGVATVGYLAICFGVALRTAKTTAEAFEWHL